MNDEITIIYKDVEELIPYINNPRKNDDAVNAVASSIKNFGFRVPITIDKDNEIITGHTRLKAAIKLGLEKVPVTIADDLTDAQVKAFRLADNKVSEFSKWDYDLLGLELESLDNLEDIDMTLFGFEDYHNDFPDIDLLDDIYFEDEEQHKKDNSTYLSWGKNKIYLSEEDESLLNMKYKQFKAEDTTLSFIKYLIK